MELVGIFDSILGKTTHKTSMSLYLDEVGSIPVLQPPNEFTNRLACTSESL